MGVGTENMEMHNVWALDFAANNDLSANKKTTNDMNE